MQELSWGVFDKEWVPKHESGKEGVYWEEFIKEWKEGREMSDQEGEKALLENMDFSLVSICISHDDFVPPPMETMILLAKAMPEVVRLYGVMDPSRKRQLKENEGWVETRGLGERLKRAGTATKADFMGRGLMKFLAVWCVQKAREEGWRSVLVNTSAGAVSFFFRMEKEGRGGGG